MILTLKNSPSPSVFLEWDFLAMLDNIKNYLMKDSPFHSLAGQPSLLCPQSSDFQIMSFLANLTYFR